MRHMRIFNRLLVLLFLLGLSACNAAEQTGTVQPGTTQKLTPYHTATLTPTVTSTPEGLPTSTHAPTATPTPRVYKVQANDTLLGIASYFGLTLAELQAANPGVQPALLAIGTELIIPAAAAVAATATVPAPASSYAVNMLDTRCMLSLTGGYHCFALVANAEDFALANLTAEFTLTDAAGAERLSRTVALPLNQLPADARLPFYTYFNPPVFTDAKPAAELLTVTAASDENVKAVPLVFEGTKVMISADGIAATVSGNARLAQEGSASGSYTLVGVAYDVEGRVVGIRRLSGESGWSASTDIEFSLTVYSTGGKIDSVEIFGEAE